MRILSWEDLKRLQRYRRDLMRRELAVRTKPRRRRPRQEEKVLKLAGIAAEAFRAWFEVVECRKERRVLRMKF